MDFAKILNALFTGLNKHLDNGFKSVVGAVGKIKNEKEVARAISTQTGALRVAFTKLDKALDRVATPPPVQVEIDVNNRDVVLQLEKMGIFEKTDMTGVASAMSLLLEFMEANKPESMIETFDAFGRAIRENKPKDQVTIDPKQMEGLMAALTNIGGGTALPAPHGGLYSGRKVVATAGTAVQLSSTSVRCENIIITAESNNADLIAVGDSSVVAAAGSEQGVLLTPLGSVRIGIGDLSKIYIDAVTSSDGVSFAYER